MPVDLPDPRGSQTPTDPLRADCGRCVGLCCVAPAFAESADFAIDKPAGQPCPHLNGDFACRIHSSLPARGFRGCTVYDCFGAGQHVVQTTFGGRDWRPDRRTARQMFAVFHVVRELHELLWYLRQALGLSVAGPLHSEIHQLQHETERLRDQPPDELERLDLEPHWAAAKPLLTAASALVRDGVPRRGRDRRGADLIGRDLRQTRLRGADLRGAYLLGADLRGADLTCTDLIGADLRAADVRGADLSTALFLTQPQLASGRGDSSTQLPPGLDRPTSWSS